MYPILSEKANLTGQSGFRFGIAAMGRVKRHHTRHGVAITPAHFRRYLMVLSGCSLRENERGNGRFGGQLEGNFVKGLDNVAADDETARVDGEDGVDQSVAFEVAVDERGDAADFWQSQPYRNILRTTEEQQQKTE